MKKEKILELRESVFNLTGEFKSAMLLSKFLQWDKEAREVNADFDGWLHKDSETISDETMMGMKAQTVRKYMLKLEDLHLIESRQSNTLLDRTYEYRINHDYINRLMNQNG